VPAGDANILGRYAGRESIESDKQEAQTSAQPQPQPGARPTSSTPVAEEEAARAEENGTADLAGQGECPSPSNVIDKHAEVFPSPCRSTRGAGSEAAIAPRTA
jgi:hypothetical protein